MEIIIEFLSFLKYRRKYWLWPLFFIMISLGLIVVLAHGSAIGPLLYSLF
ncbi:DUF5989 family protein [Mucilaginibacter sabulilitoris]|uniref:DUF5989 family protein n=1 Tax=Mucilaginibacter sabulilitoris TaxID=1173583 RepID=A0ABZ0TU17_9SPHI|nr:DUF5989 family protein [Mucilaginibacter sabulilitoris]WPU95568.1 DUF5989 family protein [Mucilaginibacter sabulilitoris]